MSKLVTLLSCDDLSMAYIARSKLEAAGIPCFLANEYLAGVNRLYSPAVGGVELQVLESDVPEALALLTETPDPNLGPPPGEGTEAEPAPGSDTEPEEEEEAPDACPHCGATESEARSLGHSLLALSVFLGLPLPFRFKWRRCKQCGRKWR